jgi:hypothetical protein
MHKSDGKAIKSNKLKLSLRQLCLCTAVIMLMVGVASAGEGGGIVYPIGVETVMPAYAPAPRQLVMQEFTLFYSASRFNDSHGNAAIPGFRITEFANCVKFKYNWGQRFLGGDLMSGGGLVQAYAQVEANGATQTKTNLANQDIEPVFVVYVKGPLHFQYGLDIWTPGPSYNKNDLVNVGQHYWDFEPVVAVTWLPNKGRTELSSRLHYALKTTNPDNNYHSGSEISWEFNATQNVSKKVAVGFQGYLLKQVRDDTIGGVSVGDGNRSQALGVGPQLRIEIAKGVIAFKYFHETEVRYHPIANSFWFEFGFPIHNGSKKE